MGALIAEFNVEGTPKLYNSIGRKSWHVKAREAKIWLNKVIFHCKVLGINDLKLERAKIFFTRHSSKEPDFDSLVLGFKHPLDGLVKAQVIIDDKSKVIGQPSYAWKYRPRKDGGLITIRIEAVEGEL